MQSVCGLDHIVNGRKYSTATIEEGGSSVISGNCSHQNLNFRDECHISLKRFNKKGVNGREMRYIQAKATLLTDEVDEAHDLFYLVRIPENSPVQSP